MVVFSISWQQTKHQSLEQRTLCEKNPAVTDGFPPQIINMMTSSNGNVFHVTGPLCGEFTGRRWIPHTKASDVELWCFLWSSINSWVNNNEAGDLIRHRAHYDVIVMKNARSITCYDVIIALNASSRSAAYTRQWIGSALGQIMALLSIGPLGTYVKF